MDRWRGFLPHELLMIFNSIDFLLFFPVVYILYIYSSHKSQNLILLFASYFFYACWDYRFLSLIFLSTAIDYFTSIGIDSNPLGSRKRKLFVTISIVSNLGILGFFKYYNFFMKNAKVLLESMGIQVNPGFLELILPLGISFYTFQTMSYTIDVYRGDLKPTRSLINFALYVSFFPQLVAGPIERASRLLPQITQKRTIRWQNLQQGTFLILLGYFKKVYVADNLALVINPIFATSNGVYVEDPSGAQVALAIFAFFFQIYCDFSGYSNIARGISKYMGFELMQNFKLPAFGVNIIDVWKRWHISLTTWLRDYIYHPLGGSRVSPVRQHMNNIVVFFASGLWHGANWTYITWGVYNGILTSIYRIVQPLLPHLPGDENRVIRPIKTITKTAFTFVLFGYSGLFFRSETMTQAFDYTSKIFTDFGQVKATSLDAVVRALALLLVIELYQHIKDDEFSVFQWPVWARTLVYTLMFYSIVSLGSYNGFIYFVF
ncbi:MAG: MBOAT family O-acyltransferase [Spirochaetota bacterium]